MGSRGLAEGPVSSTLHMYTGVKACLSTQQQASAHQGTWHDNEVLRQQKLQLQQHEAKIREMEGKLTDLESSIKQNSQSNTDWVALAGQVGLYGSISIYFICCCRGRG